MIRPRAVTQSDRRPPHRASLDGRLSEETVLKMLMEGSSLAGKFVTVRTLSLGSVH